MEQLSLGPLFHKKKKKYGLHKNFLPKNKRWLMDCDYADQLSEYDRMWLDQFNREYCEGAIKKGDGTALHYKDDMRKTAYRDNSRRTRDLYAIKECGGALDLLEPWTKVIDDSDSLIEKIDSECLGKDEIEIFVMMCFDLEMA